jgi:glycerol-3-phosphate acyltransferase PlsY
MSVIIYPVLLNRFSGEGLHNIIAIIIMLLIIYFHRGNIRRIWAGTENKLNLKSKKKNTGLTEKKD